MAKDEMIQTAIRLPRSLHEKLRKIGGERGMGEEIRQRLELSFEYENAPDDAETAALLESINAFAKVIGADVRWHKSAYSFAIFKSAVDAAMEHYRPKGDAKPEPGRTQFKEGDPETVGRTIADVLSSVPKAVVRR